ncbi:MAG: hypothetical protein JWO13_38 [Acidobacteriales bacterium]|nr:hypothetical protein [Terriglobales bacterium]
MACGLHLLQVKLTAKILSCALMLIVMGVPVMACMQADTTMTAEESDCCKQMAGDCGDMGATSGHDCCKKAEIRIHSAILQQNHSAIFMDAAAGVSVPSLTLHEEQVNTTIPGLYGHSPPESPPATVQILRI